MSITPFHLPLAAAAGGEIALLINLMLILAGATAVTVLLQRMRMAVIPAYLIAGALMGPLARRFVESGDEIMAISNLAIILLLFGIGLHMDLSVMRQGMARMFAVGIAAVALCVLIGWPTAMAFGLSPPRALAVSMALSLSSTAVVMRQLMDRRELRSPNGRLALAILIVQDLAVIGMLALLPALAVWEGAGQAAAELDAAGGRDWVHLLPEAAGRIGVIILVLAVGKWLAPRLLHEAASSPAMEVMMIASVAIALGTAIATRAAGFSLELGAFLGGFMLAGTPFRHQLAGQIGPLRDLFIAVFFTTVGMELDMGTVAQWWWLILLAGVLMGTLKALLIGGASWAMGMSLSVATAVGLALFQAGEFSIVILTSAAEEGIVGERVLAVSVAVVIISLILTPLGLELGRRLGLRLISAPGAPWLRRGEKQTAGADHGEPDDGRQHVILGGYGPIGRQIDEALQEAGVSVAIVELNHRTVDQLLREGRRAVFGDVGILDVLESAGLERADALILTIPDERAVLRACSMARRVAPELFIMARTGLKSRGKDALAAGADHVVVEEEATAREMHRVVMERIQQERSHAKTPSRKA